MTGRHKRGRGRPLKEIDIGVMVHMMRNGAPLRAVAKAVGVNRDTLYSRYWDVIEAGRAAHHQYYLDNREEWYRVRGEAWQCRQIERNCGVLTNSRRRCKFAKVANGRCAIHQGK
jgi:hypothetical protein